MTKLQAAFLSASLIAVSGFGDAFASAAPTVDEVRLVGMDEDRADRLLAKMATQVGMPVSPRGVAGDIKRLWAIGDFEDVRVWQTSGGRRVTFEVRLHPLSDELEANRGGELLIERFEIVGNGKTRENVIRRELEVGPGDVLTRESLATSAKRIRALGFFDSVALSVKPGSTARLAVVRLEVKERDTGRFEVGGSYGEVSGIGFSASVAQGNLFGTGQGLLMRARLARRLQTFELQYTNPRIADSVWRGSGRVYNSRQKFLGFEREAVGGSVSLGRPISENNRVELRYRLENVATKASAGDVLALSRDEGFASELFGSGLISSVRADLIHMNRGRQGGIAAGVYGEVASSVIGSDTSFRRYGAWTSAVKPIGHGFQASVRASADLITSSDASGVPLGERFQAGGIRGVRGYAHDGLGPRIVAPGSQSVGLGGNLRLLASVELEFPLIAAAGLSGVAFADIGNVFNLERRHCRADCPSAIELLSGMRAAVGAGVRWTSPLGKLRFEWGVPLTRRASDPAVRFHFGVGPRHN